MSVSIVIENGTVVTPLGVVKTDIAIDGEKILALGPRSVLPKAAAVVNASGKIVIPGGIDSHSHYEFKDTEETWDIGTAAAAIGGTTTTIDFAPQEKGESLLEAVKKQLSRAKELSVIDYTTRPRFGDFSDLDKIFHEMREVVDFGIPTFKIFTINRAKGIYADDWQLYSVLRRAKELGAMVTIHAENCLIAEENREDLVKKGRIDPKYHAVAQPNFVENLDVQKCMMLAEVLETKTCIVHISTGESPEIIASYRQKGLPVFCETCPHYLMLTDDVFQSGFPVGTHYICSPPFRKKEDIEAMWKALREGKVQIIGSDHVAFTTKQKEKDSFADVPTGLPGCEVRVPIVFSEGVKKRGLSLQKFVEVVSTNTAILFGLYPRKGIIAPGSDADIVIIDPEKKHSLNATDLHMGTDLSVYEGMEVTGWPVVSILRGEIIAQNDRFVGKSGSGRFIEGKLEN